MNKKQNPPAFARPFADNGKGDYSIDQEGMSLRDYFASQALAGVLTKYNASEAQLLASLAYKIADAMLAERQKEST